MKRAQASGGVPDQSKPCPPPAPKDSSTDGDRRACPPYFLLVGWSWLVFGLLGLLLGVLNIPSFFYLDNVRAILRQPPFDAYPLMAEPLLKGLNLLIPLTLLQIGLSIVMSLFSWFFLKRKNWARLALSAVNLVTLILMLWGIYLFNEYLNRVWISFGMADLVQAGAVGNIPLIANLILLVFTILCVAPLIWMGWYFHQRRIREYFKNP